MTISAAQIRAARALLDWTADRLGVECGLDGETITGFERGADFPTADEAGRLRAVLERSGIMLLPADGYGAGVRFRVREGGADAGLRPEELNSANDG
jgi:hypothetical protein